MGTRTMGSHGKELYNLTLDEVQRQLGDLGKPLSSMNINELIKSVWNAESEVDQGGINRETRLASVSSSVADLSKKTIDELWQDMLKKKDDNDIGHDVDEKSTREERTTLGEMTLEDFLAKAGIVAESSQEKKSSGLGSEAVALPQPAQWMQYQVPPVQQQHVFMPGHHPAQQMISDVGYSETQMTVSSDTQMSGRKRVASGDLMDKTVERRQKRMIKNRESAARSRARKQAYTHELENKVSRLEEENERLKREQEAEKALPCVPPPEPRYQLRRTTSASF
ncbi:putative transcription factor bZIP family [Helianthus annuus]|nr:putative transcription factor bZIP family [Helianthus annuus]KAJ0849568.1 putative transcription factor bZIP family [Helianthus annuus]